MDMENKKIFLSSSITEFKSERDSIGNYIRMLNQEVFMAQGIYLWLLQCEDYSKAVGTERKQDRYNRDIADSDYFYALIGEKAGERTVEELDMALEGFRQRGIPKVYTYFKSFAGSISRDPSVSELMSRIETEMGHDCSRFTELDSVKLDMLIEILRDHPGLCEMRFDKGEVMINGREILSLENIPIYSKNEIIQGLNSQLEKLSAEFDDISKQIDACPEDENLKVKRFRISKNIDDISEKLTNIENNLLSFYKNIIGKRSESNISIYERRALRLVEEGDYEGALAILRDGQLKKELDLAVSMAEAAKDRIRQYISGQRTRIEILKTQGINVEREKEIVDIYEEITSLAEKYNLELDCLMDYANFLLDQKKYSKGMMIAYKIKSLFKLNAKEGYPREYYLLLEILFRSLLDNNKFREAEEVIIEAQMIRETINFNAVLDEKEDAFYEADLAVVKNDLARLLDSKRRYKDAEKLYREALDMSRRLAKENPSAYEADVAINCNNLANLLTITKKYKEAEELFREALDIERRLVKENPSAYEADVAANCNNLAVLLEEIGRYKDAEKLYREALDIKRKIAKENPSAYEADVAQGCINLAIFLRIIKKYEEAEELFGEAKDIRKRLREKPD